MSLVPCVWEFSHAQRTGLFVFDKDGSMAIIYKPGLDEVRNRTGEGNLIPVYREMPADLETPVSVYLKLCVRAAPTARGPSFLLESVEKGEQLGALQLHRRARPHDHHRTGDQVTIGGAGGAVLEEQRQGEPLAVRQGVDGSNRTPVSPGLPRFTGGAVGYFGYDLVRFMERLPATAADAGRARHGAALQPTTWWSSTMCATA
jgi:anthranilate synthase component 1